MLSLTGGWTHQWRKWSSTSFLSYVRVWCHRHSNGIFAMVTISGAHFTETCHVLCVVAHTGSSYVLQLMMCVSRDGLWNSLKAAGRGKTHTNIQLTATFLLFWKKCDFNLKRSNIEWVYGDCFLFKFHRSLNILVCFILFVVWIS